MFSLKNKLFKGSSQSKSNPPSSAESSFLFDSVSEHLPAHSPAHSAADSAEHSGMGSPASINPDFSLGIQGWFGQCCKAELIPGPQPQANIVRVTERTEGWQGLAQELGPSLVPGQPYRVIADVSVGGAGIPMPTGVQVLATVAATSEDATGKTNTRYFSAGSVQAVPGQWRRIDNTFTLPADGAPQVPPRSKVYLEGPGAGVELLVSYFAVFPVATFTPVARLSAPAPVPAAIHVDESKNAVVNGRFFKGTSSWGTMANAGTLSAHPASPSGSPDGPPAELSLLPTAWPSTLSAQHRAREGRSQGGKPPLAPFAGPTAGYLQMTGRREPWHGPSQDMGRRIKLMTTYAVTAWVRVAREGTWKPGSGPAAKGPPWLEPPVVNLCLSVDSGWVNCGMVEASWSEWVRCWGSFRLETPFKAATLYAQGPGSGVDILLADVRVMEVCWRGRLEYLRDRTEQVRKKVVTVRVRTAAGSPASGAVVTANQTSRAFPIGTCINAHSFLDPKYQRFFLDHFNVAVFENELKWALIEHHRGHPDFGKADMMLQWLKDHRIPVRAHCLFWDNEVPSWLKGLPAHEVMAAIDERVESVVGRYRGEFIHYDVNNEMLHGGYFEQGYGVGAVVRMFQKTNSMDPDALLFLNDYHTDDGCCAKSHPSKYAEHARSLLAKGAPVHGIGVQGHISAPVGAHLQHSFDVLGSTGLPVWITELDVESVDENIRADDFEIYLREAYAHEAVEGVLLWGFWEGAMSRKNAHLVDKNWVLSPTGKRLEGLLQEWTTRNVSGSVDGSSGAMSFRGFPGAYSVSVSYGGITKQVDLSLGSVDTDWDIVLDV